MPNQKKDKNPDQKTLTRSSIRESFHQKLGLSAEVSSDLLESILGHMTEMILTNSSVKIVSFGTFLVHTKKERIGRNPKTKVEAVITPRKSVSFRPSPLLRQQVAENGRGSA
jgi:integration host factor subunit alpha